MSNKAHLFFDLDRTLWDFERNSLETLRGLFEDFRLEDHGAGDFEEFNRVYQRVNALCWAEYRDGRMEKEVLRTERFTKSLACFGIDDASLAEGLGIEYVQRGPHQRHLLPGTLEVLGALRGRGHSIHILTNGFSEIQHIKVENTGIALWIDTLLTSEQLGALKPARACFEAALEATESRADQAWMIGDDHEADVIGSHEAGWRAVHFNPTGNAADGTPAVATVTDLRQLLAVLP